VVKAAVLCRKRHLAWSCTAQHAAIHKLEERDSLPHHGVAWRKISDRRIRLRSEMQPIKAFVITCYSSNGETKYTPSTWISTPVSLCSQGNTDTDLLRQRVECQELISISSHNCGSPLSEWELEVGCGREWSLELRSIGVKCQHHASWHQPSLSLGFRFDALQLQHWHFMEVASPRQLTQHGNLS